MRSSCNRERVEWKGKKPITTKSELLFVWMMLDLLRIGGRCAVVVPDGVLFGSTNAHKELRRKLLFENTLEGVVSLPGGVFNPYSGVKTSILIFQKVGDESKAGQEPRTKEVWFYEVAEEAKTLDQKRKDRYEGPNDLYDASEKFHNWYEVIQGSDLPKLREAASSTTYYKPEYWKERWRVIDDDFLRIFPEEESQKGHALGLHEIFDGMEPDSDQRPDLEKITKTVCDDGKDQLLASVTPQFIQAAWATGAKQKTAAKKLEKAATDLNKRVEQLKRDLTKRSREKSILDREYDQYGLTALKQTLDELKAELQASLEAVAKEKQKPDKDAEVAIAEETLDSVLNCYARLDGYEIWLRSVNSLPHEQKPTKSDDDEPVSDVLAWVTPVRAWAKLESWKDPNSDKDVQKPTHDADGLVDPSYVKWLIEECNAFEDVGTVKSDYLELLDPDCIEAADMNLSAGRHKPFVFSAKQHKRPDDLIRKLDKVHEDIRKKLATLLSMVEG
ncbi:N-6 DNA methylase [Stieleria magnilauensis]|uniref:site-specific DNA-methyltransferase (adenine-specific) n=1 Tax=Stieleria magnilauensis TaxID=2527963 RepID=A0ABX5XUB8_9BACT|nr:putative type I restriction enzymeP M protein [Planctomycetes bacterium TBK1r]